MKAAYFDGESSARATVEVRVQGGDLRLLREGGGEVLWRRGEYRKVSVGEGPLRLERGLQALVIDDPGLKQALGHRPGRWRRLVALSAGGTLLCLVLGYAFGLPALARLVAGSVPPSWEVKLGEEVLSSLAPKDDRCGDPALNQAVADISQRLVAAAQEAPYPVQVVVVRSDVVNAFAAPGGMIAVHTGLIRRMQRPEELAGVLAHELQHVLSRHPTQGLVRALSVNAMLSVLVGDATTLLGVAATFGQLKYQRDDEEQADEAGLRLLARAGIDPAGLPQALSRLDDDIAGLPAEVRYLSSHPLTPQRVASLTALAKQHGEAAPLLPGVDWASLIKACAGSPPADR